MSDLISRQAAIDAVSGGMCSGWDCDVIDKLEALPSAQPRKGFWYALEKGDKGYSAGDFKCSVCGEPNHTWLPKPNFCPNCGSYNGGEQE